MKKVESRNLKNKIIWRGTDEHILYLEKQNFLLNQEIERLNGINDCLAEFIKTKTKKESKTMKLEEAKNIIEKTGTIEAVKKLLNVQFDILTNNKQKHVEELQSQYDALRDITNDLMSAKNFEDLQNMVKNIYDHGDTKD